MAREICKNEKVLYIRFRINCENISNHPFCLMALNGLNEEHYSKDVAPKDTKMRSEVLYFEAMTSSSPMKVQI